MTINGAKHIPVLYGVEWLLICHIIHQNESHRTTVVGRRYRPIPLLSSSVLHSRAST